MVAARDISAGSRWVPFSRASCPTLRFSALFRMYPGRAGPRIRTVLPTSSESSTITMASAPSGTGAPVMIRQASPVPTSGGASPPALLVPTMESVVPSALQSTTRTAHPSMAELSNLGSSTFDARFVARTRPAASSNCTVSVFLPMVSRHASSMARCRVTLVSMAVEWRLS